MMDLRQYLPPNMRGRAMEYFCYGVDQLPLAAGARVTTNTTIQNDADFVLLAAAGRVSDPAAVATVFTDPPITVQVMNSGSQQLQSQPVPIGALFSLTGLTAGGVAGVGGALPVPYIFKAGATLGTTLVNLAAATAFDLRLTYIGVKVYYFEWTA